MGGDLVIVVRARVKTQRVGALRYQSDWDTRHRPTSISILGNEAHKQLLNVPLLNKVSLRERLSNRRAFVASQGYAPSVSKNLVYRLKNIIWTEFQRKVKETRSSFSIDGVRSSRSTLTSLSFEEKISLEEENVLKSTVRETTTLSAWIIFRERPLILCRVNDL